MPDNEQDAESVVPPEVRLDLCGRQILARFDNGDPFPRYVECAGGCGYLIGCGDAQDTMWHGSCWRHSDGRDDA